MVLARQSISALHDIALHYLPVGVGTERARREVREAVRLERRIDRARGRGDAESFQTGRAAVPLRTAVPAVIYCTLHSMTLHGMTLHLPAAMHRP